MMLLSLVCVKGLLMALKEVVVRAIVCILFLLIPRLFHTHTQRPVDGTFSATNAHTLFSIITHSLAPLLPHLFSHAHIRRSFDGAQGSGCVIGLRLHLCFARALLRAACAR